jgi:transposase-like protein
MTTSTTPTARLILTAAERQLILEEYDSYPRGDARRGALLRRYGRYTSQMSKWRERRKRGAATLAAPTPGPKPAPRNPLADEVVRLTRANTRLQQQLTNAETIIAIQKKVATRLDLLPIPPSAEAS